MLAQNRSRWIKAINMNAEGARVQNGGQAAKEMPQAASQSKEL